MTSGQADDTTGPLGVPEAHTRPTQGIDRLLSSTRQLARLGKRRVALLSNRASRTAAGDTVAGALAAAVGTGRQRGLVLLFAPEHGWDAAAPEGKPIGDATDTETGLPVHSLYGSRAAADSGRHTALDTIIIDLRDVGVRCYTYAATAAMLLERTDPKTEIIVCDRPNPLGPGVAGPRPRNEFRSLLAYLDVPFIHGQTIGTLLAAFAKGLPGGGPRLSVCASDPADDANDAPWVPPSPGLAHPDAVQLYPGLVLLEGANASQGRGTAFPFRSVLAPWLDGGALADRVNRWPQLGVIAHPVTATPGRGTFQGVDCHGVRFDLVGPERPDGLALGIRLLHHLATCYPDFRWVRAGPPGSETSADRYFIDLIVGGDELRHALARGATAEAILAEWTAAA